MKIINEIKRLPDQTLKGVVLPDEKIAELKAFVAEYERLAQDALRFEDHSETTFMCPRCNGNYFGTSTMDGVSTGHCHSCNSFSWLRKDDGKYFKLVTIMDIPDDELDGHGLGR